MNKRPTEQLAVLGVINPASVSPSTVVSGWISSASAFTFLATINIGAITATGTVDAKIQQATSSAGAGAKDITSKAITQMTATGSNSNQLALINLRDTELDVNGGFTYFQLSITVGTAAAILGATIYGVNNDSEPAYASNIAAVNQVVL